MACLRYRKYNKEKFSLRDISLSLQLPLLMSSAKYSRLPSNVPPRKYKFPALEGPGYFTYDSQPRKFASMFTYSRMSSAEYSSPSDSSTASLLSVEAQPVHEQIGVYGDQSHAGASVAGIQVRDVQDNISMQADLDQLVEWADKWQMQFNVSKCKVMHVGQKNPRSLYYEK